MTALHAREVLLFALVAEACATSFLGCLLQVRVERSAELPFSISISHVREEFEVFIAAYTDELVFFERFDSVCMCALPPDLLGVGLTRAGGTR